MFSTILSSVGIGATTAAGSVSMLNVALAATVAGAVVLGITAIAGALLSLAGNANKAAENAAKLYESIDTNMGQTKGLDEYKRKIEGLASASTNSADDVAKFNEIRAELEATFPGIKTGLDDEITSVNDLAGAYETLLTAVQNYSHEQAIRNWRTAYEGYDDAAKTWNNTSSYYRENSLGREAGTTIEPLRWAMWDPVVYSDISGSSLGDIRTAIASAKSELEFEAQEINEILSNIGLSSLEALQAEIAITEAAIESYREVGDKKAVKESTNYLNDLKKTEQDLLDKYKVRETIESQLSDMETYLETGMEELEAELDNFISAAVLKMVNPAKYPQLEQFIPNILDHLLNSDINPAWDSEQIEAYISRYIDRIAELTNEELATKFGDIVDGSGATSTSESGADPKRNFDAELAQAFELLEKVQTLRESIDEMMESGGLSESIVDALKGVLGDEGWQAILDDAAERVGGLNFENLLAALNEALTEATAEMDSNLLIAALGLGEDSEAAVQEAIDKLAEAADIDKLAEIWESLPQKTKDAMGEAGQQIEELLQSTAKDAEDSATRIEKALKRIKDAAEMKDLIDTNKVWEDLDGIVDNLTSTMDKAMGAISDINDKLNDAGTAAGALEAAMAGDQEAIDYLAGVTGLAADTLANDLSPAELLVSEMGDQAIASMEYLINMFIALNAVQVDPSGKLVAIGSIEEAANNAGTTVAALMSFLASVNGSGFSFTTGPTGLKITSRVPKITWTGGKSGSSSRKSSGGGGGKKSGGGGGGGSGSNSVSELVESMLDEFDRVNALRDHRRELAQMGQSYHEARGEIQGVIAYLQIERDIVEEDTKALEAYLGQLEAQIEANRAIVTTEAAGSKAYNQAMIDLDKLQEEHQKYSKTLVQNKTDVENLTDAIKKQYDKIRQMEIDLRNTILEAIEDREAANERMLSGRIAMEEEIMDRIKKRYEAERDQIIETQDARKSALEDEIDQIDELLAQRKKLAEQDDKMKEIAELEAQIMRISADPTRQKEALQLRQKLAKLREDMAWDAAEAEAQAQKDSIKKQITSIEDYIKYVQDYYEELFKNPQKLIEEMQEILTWTDDQIIAWLKKNTEDYYSQTEAVQKRMVQEWQDTLDDMRDTIRTYWAEVETIIDGGAENILNFLMTYSQKYREAGKLQAEAYVDEWKQQLKDLENAYKQVNANIQSYDYVKTTKVDSGSSGGGGGGGGGTGSTAVSTPKKTYYRWEYANASGGWVTSTKNVINQSAFDGAKKYAMDYWSKHGGNMAPIILQQIAAATMAKPGKYLRQGTPLYEYATGGMNTTTGLAWLDGTKSRPERILSSYQTELFEDMINTLHQIRSVSTGGIMSAPKLTAGSTLPNIDQIVINIEQLNSDTDYDDAAERLMNAFYTKVARTRPVGGIQGW